MIGETTTSACIGKPGLAILQIPEPSMRNLSGKAAINSRANVVLLAAIALASCTSTPTPDQPPVTKVDKPFAAAGSIEMQLDGGDYSVRASADEHIRVSFAGNIGNAA